MQTDSQIKRKIKTFINHAGFEILTEGFELILLAGGGSDRSFYRINIPAGSFIVMTAPAFTHEIRAYVEVGNYLYKNRVRVPEIIAYDDEKHMVLLEDIGDNSLYSLLKSAGTEKKVMGYYKKALMFLREMQNRAAGSAHACNYLKHRTFGYEALRWETDYFMECFIKRFSGTAVENRAKVERELHMLASGLAGEPRHFMHRDFQSQNIFFKNSSVVVIDFQTATKGLLQYDLASLLKDAYFELADRQRDELLLFYIDILNNKQKMNINAEDFIRTFHLAGLQRNMQALGAFAFLSMEKGKTRFLQYIPSALYSLHGALSMFPEFPALRKTVEKAVCSLKEQKS